MTNRPKTAQSTTGTGKGVADIGKPVRASGSRRIATEPGEPLLGDAKAWRGFEGAPPDVLTPRATPGKLILVDESAGFDSSAESGLDLG
jgi:hypothetical protein